jgi:uncharacterized repeat protein (TIGR01451 family)
MQHRAVLAIAFVVVEAGGLRAQDPPPPAFEYFLEGASSLAASPGEDVPFEVTARILSLNIDDPAEGAEAFSMGIRISGDCTLVSTEGEIEAGLLERLRTAFGAGFAPGFIEVDVTEEAEFTAVTAGVVFDFDTRVVLDPVMSPHEVLGLRLEGRIPDGAPCRSCLIEHVDGLRGGGRPIRNVVTSRSVSVAAKPASKSITIASPPCTEHAAAALTEQAPSRTFPPTPLASCKKTACFQFTVGSQSLGKPVLIRWNDPAEQNSTRIFLKRDAPAGPGSFDLASGSPGVHSPRLVLPEATAGTWFVGVVSDLAAETAGTLGLDILDMSVEEVLPRRGARGTEASVVILGGGFRAPMNGQDGTTFRLAHEGTGDAIDPIPGSVTIVSPGRAEMAFDLPDSKEQEPESYRAEVLLQGVAEPIDSLPAAFVIGPRLGHGLGARADGQRAYGRERSSRFTLSYRFEGDEAIAAPLFKIVGPPEVKMRLDRECFYQPPDAPLLVLGINPDGFAGRLAPGASYDLPIIFETPTAGPAAFQLYLFTPRRSERIPWSTAARPPGVGEEDWADALPRLEALLGTFWPEHHERLAGFATRLSRRGIDATSIGALYRHAVGVALGEKGPAAALGKVVHVSTRIPIAGVLVVADEVGGASGAGEAVTDANGDFALEGLDQGRAYVFRVPAATTGTLVEGAVPDDGDLYGLDLAVEAESRELPERCAESGEPDVPLIPPQVDTFRLLTELGTRIVTSVDPNDKEAPQGDPGPDPFEERTYVEPGDDHLYTVRFENTGDAPAHRVEIRDTLGPEFDGSKIIFRGVDLGEAPPLSLDNSGSDLFSGYHRGRFKSSLQTDVRPFYLGTRRENLSVNVDAVYDEYSRTITWTLQTVRCVPDGSSTICSIPTEFEDGFLPPNQCPPESPCPPGIGEGSVSFTVQVRPGLGDVQEVPNPAVINFDRQVDVVTNPFARSLYNPGLPPGVPRLRIPEDGDVVDASAVLHWERTPFAVSHELHLWRLTAADGGCGDKPSDHMVIPITAREQTAHAPSGGLEHDTCYKWQLIASNLAGETSESEVRSFRTTPAPPGCPEPPADLAVRLEECGEAPVLTWSGGKGAEAFQVIVIPRALTTPVLEARVPGMEYRLPSGLNRGSYDWRVSAINEGCLQGTPSPTSTLELVCFRRGDSDSNGMVQITDAVRILNVLFLGIGTIVCDDAADADDNGAVNITDAVRILNFLFLGIGDIPAPGTQTCGFDLTQDEIACRLGACTSSP